MDHLHSPDISTDHMHAPGAIKFVCVGIVSTCEYEVIMGIVVISMDPEAVQQKGFKMGA